MALTSLAMGYEAPGIGIPRPLSNDLKTLSFQTVDSERVTLASWTGTLVLVCPKLHNTVQVNCWCPSI